MIFSRQPAGFALAALHGQYPQPGLGAVAAAGPSMWDDFTPDHGSKAKSLYGELDWLEEVIGGASTIAAVTPTSWEEIGILSITTQSTANRGCTLTQGTIPLLYRYPPPGSIWACKLRLSSGTINYELWSGFSSTGASRIRTADATSFVGVRSVGGNLFGVVKSGAGAGNESTIDLGFNVEGTTWHTVGFEVKGTTAAPEFQFFTLNSNGSEAEVWDRIDVGAAITTNAPAVGLTPVAIGLVTTSTTAKTVQIDHWSWGGRIAR